MKSIGTETTQGVISEMQIGNLEGRSALQKSFTDKQRDELKMIPVLNVTSLVSVLGSI